MDDIEDLYQSIILEHYKSPHNRLPIREEEACCRASNPLCGDEVRLKIEVEADCIVSACFDGKGCVISMASASLLTETLQGQSIVNALSMIDAFLKIVRGEGKIRSDLPEEIKVLAGISAYPMRVKCATLSWRAMEKRLNHLLSGSPDSHA